MKTLTELRAAKQRAHATLSEAARKRGQGEQHLKRFRTPAAHPGLTNLSSSSQRQAAAELLQRRIDAEVAARARYEAADREVRAAETAANRAPATAKGSLRTPTVYHPQGLSWFRDMWSLRTYGNQHALERLTANGRRVRVMGSDKVLLRTPTDDSAGAGFAPPTWLGDLSRPAK